MQCQPQPSCRPPPCEPKADSCPPCICRDNDGREVETIEIDTLLKFVTAGATYMDKAGQRMSAPPDAMLQALRDSAIEFARETRLLRRVWTAPAQKGVRDYFIPTLEGERIGLINRLCVDGQCLEGAQLECGPMDAYAYGHGHGNSHGHGYSHNGFWLEPPDKLMLSEAPCRDEDCYGLRATYHAIPEYDACKIDALLATRYRHAIVYGAMANLLMLPGYEWTRPDYGVNYDKKFQMEIAEAKLEAATQYTSGARTIIPTRCF